MGRRNFDYDFDYIDEVPNQDENGLNKNGSNSVLDESSDALEKSEFSIARENEEPASIENQERTAEQTQDN